MYTYSIRAGYFDHNMIRELFTKRGNWKEYNKDTDKELTFLYVDGDNIYDDKSHFYIKTVAKNLMDQSTYKIADKVLIYKTLEKYNKEICEKYMMKQYHIDANTINDPALKNIFKGETFILKPITGYKGMGIEIFKDYNRFHHYVTNYLKTKKNATVRKGWALAKYIDNPLLYNNRKFHFRVFYLVYYDDQLKKMRGYVLKRMYLATAIKPFKMADFGNKDIHDSHFSEEGTFYFPDETGGTFDAERVAKIYDKMYTMFYHILQISDAGCYKESKYCYHVYGADVMVTTDLELKLLEINDYIGQCTLERCNKFNQYYMESQLEVVIDKWFPPAKQYEPKANGFFEITDYVKTKTGGSYYDKYIKYKNQYKLLKTTNRYHNLG
jgi:hypothetical protein